MTEPLPPLVSTEWLATRLGGRHLVVLDGSWYLPGSGRDPAAEYLAGHIPGALFFDLDAFSDSESTLPHMFPPSARLARELGELGLDDRDDIVVYDGSGANLSAPRVWWMLRALGHRRAAVLDGGIGKWRREARPLEAGPVVRPPGRFTARVPLQERVGTAELLRSVREGTAQVVDMRSAGRFAGSEPEPRPGLRGGHVPGSRSLPYQKLTREDGTLLGPGQLRERMVAAGIDLGRSIVATCGSGVSACALIHALHLLGIEDAVLYDGAWAEWGARDDLPVETGDPR